MTRHQITCINKTNRTNPHERIEFIGGLNSDGTRWRLSQQDAIRAIDINQYEFYVRRHEREVKVIVAIHLGNKYLKTTNDDITQDNLLSLVECPLSR